jgi:phage protein D
MANTKKPQFEIVYEGQDITARITPMVLSVGYTDAEHGKSDELDLQMEDRKERWIGDWFPSKGARISLKIGYQGKPLRDCGEFELEEITFSGPPSSVDLKAVAAVVTKAIRESKDVAYEGKTLRQIVQEVAGRHSWTVVGEIEDIMHERVTQRGETDLQFLKRLGETYGYQVKTSSGKLVFRKRQEAKAEDATMTINRHQVISYSFVDKTVGTYKGVKAKGHNSQLNAYNEWEKQAAGGES